MKNLKHTKPESSCPSVPTDNIEPNFEHMDSLLKSEHVSKASKQSIIDTHMRYIQSKEALVQAQETLKKAKDNLKNIEANIKIRQSDKKYKN